MHMDGGCAVILWEIAIKTRSFPCQPATECHDLLTRPVFSTRRN
jgi:hypothetical protein